MCNNEDALDEELDDNGSGPFCSHWDDPADCDNVCKCGHTCSQHYAQAWEWACVVEGCECTGFRDQ